ncbi:MAG: MATE family efflux transporter [Pseudomonadota bacterium]
MNAPSAPPARSTVTLRSVFAIALPMTLAHATTPLIGITDMAVIGQLGSAALIGAVALGALLFSVIGGTLNFLRMGTTGLVAQALGAGNKAAEAAALWRALIVALLLGAIIVVLQEPVLWLFLLAMDPSAEVARGTAQYWSVRVWATPFMLGSYAILGWLLGLGRARTGLALQLLLSVINIIGSLVLVLVFELDVFGVAAASVAAEAAMFAAGTVIVARSLAHTPRPSFAAILERAGVVRTLVVNRDIFIRSVLVLLGFSFFSAVGARYGDLILAANAVLMNLFLLSTHVLDGLATAAEQLGGRAVGARDRAAFRKTVKLTVVAGTVIGMALCLFWLLAGPPAIALITSAQDVQALAGRYLPWVAVSALTGVVAFVMDGLYIGATWTRTMRDMMLASTLVFIGAWWVFAPHFGNDALWFALNLWLLLRGVTLFAFLPRQVRATFPDQTRDRASVVS